MATAALDRERLPERAHGLGQAVSWVGVVAMGVVVAASIASTTAPTTARPGRPEPPPADDTERAALAEA